MNYLESPGIVYDMLFYTTVFFSRHNVECNIQQYTEIKDILYHYDTIRRAKHVLDPPSVLYPLFFYNGKTPCIMTDYFQDTYNFYADSPEDFINGLKNKPRFKRFVLTKLLCGCSVDVDDVLQNKGEAISDAIIALSKHMDISSLSYFFYHFSGLVDTLIEFLTALLPIIRAYHKKCEQIAKKSIDTFTSEELRSVALKSCSKITNEFFNFQAQRYSVCYLSQYVIMYQCDNTNYTFLLGCDCCVILQQTVDYSFMTIESIMKSFGHTVKLDIIKELFKRDLTISQLSRALHVSRSSIGRYVDDLLEELTLTRIRKIGPEIYLHLNMEYIKRAKTIFNDFIDQLTLESDDVKGGEI